MSAIQLALMIFGIMLVLMAIRIPIAITMFIAGGIGYVMAMGMRIAISTSMMPKIIKASWMALIRQVPGCLQWFALQNQTGFGARQSIRLRPMAAP